jgi:hypothetical protein
VLAFLSIGEDAFAVNEKTKLADEIFDQSANIPSRLNQSVAGNPD